MAKFKIETCPQESVDELCEYIDSDWVKEHIFVKSRMLLDWQHLNKSGQYNFIIARDPLNDEICGVLGFVFTSHFSELLESERDVWLAIWKVREGAKYSGLGLKLLAYLKREYKVKTICSIGLSKTVVPMYKFLKFDVGQLKQFVLINENISKYNVIELGAYSQSEEKNDKSHTLTRLNDEDILSISKSEAKEIFSSYPKKNVEYIINRFIKHPIYTYEIYSINYQGIIKGLIVTRVIEVNNSKVMRIIDFQGIYESLSYLNNQLLAIIVKKGCEYIDFVQKGIPEDYLTSAGFVDVNNIEGLIVPEYFEPLVKKNITLDYARLGDESNFLLCKGDSDQDRPSKIKGP
ncbi:hypothetical protein A9Q81_16685 [Gammaproteobacteria bacterium 42_54_T18]|nr:hypothetical protein A9Q81_16685 [Gammaproteobacteria bacterium 42_54_T18]